ncbi:B-cell receptor CD22-like [Melanotaenia boesemani]|uniref:B-cell receptor CD22-like n=1 Tax=Melanotaenia boesemani TaxID=1250792 RepID=UPI001C049ADE|nr:B-cell receptor CD22-like [Melanotaenia boesemani]
MITSLNMCAGCGFLKLMLILLVVEGVLSSWGVQYQQQHYCAVKGSSVVMLCSFTYPDINTVQSVKWGRGNSAVYSGPFIYDSESNYTSLRYQYIGDKKRNCSFKILQVEPNDAGKFTFRFITNKNKWTGRHGPKLRVVDLNISSNGAESVKEGDAVSLTCTNSCNDDQFSSALTWFRNGHFLKEGPELYLGSLSTTDSGKYTCSLKVHPGTTSKVMQIDVEYSPKNTSVSVRPSTEVDAGSNVTLICSSNANPVENYTWFRKHNNNFIVVGHQPEHQIKEFVQSIDQYFCTATNKHGSQNSSVVTLTTKAHWAKHRNVLIISTCIAIILIVTTVVIITRIVKKRTISPGTDCEAEAEVENTIYANWAMLDAGRSREGSVHESELVYATVNFNDKRKADMEQQMDSRDIDGCAIYSTVCRTSSLKP